MAPPALFFLALSLLFLSASSQTLNMTTKLVGSDSRVNDEFGIAVAASGNLVVVGAHSDAIGTQSYQGSAHVFQCSPFSCTWKAKLVASDGKADDRFGIAVAISGSLIVVGAYSADSPPVYNHGAAYVFDCSSFPCIQRAKLVASDLASMDAFGFSVGISGRLVVAGAWVKTVGSNTQQGSAYVFNCTSFPCIEGAKLIDTNGSASDQFGRSVAISGTTVVAGAPKVKIGSNTSQGAAFVFDCSSFPCTQRARLVASDGGAGDNFGSPVSISGNLVGAGASANIGPNNGQGAAYLYDCSSFPCTHKAKLVASDGAAMDFFGISLSISGTRVVVGAHQDDVGSTANQGSAYAFDCSSFPCTQTAKLVAADGAASDYFGISVGISGTLVVAGSYLSDLPSNSNQGAAYTIDLNPPVSCSAETLNGESWPETALTATAFLPCPPGYTGSKTRTCSSVATWGAVSNATCIPIPPCPAAADYAHVAWPQTPAGQTATGTCVPGYANSSNGPPTRVCPPSGANFSSLVTNHCVRLSCPAILESNAIWNTTFALSTRHSTCNAGFVGSPSRVCLANGTWGSISNPCTPASLSCPAELYIRANWPITPSGQPANGTCILGWTGAPTRICKLDGTWQDLVSNHCIRI